MVMTVKDKNDLHDLMGLFQLFEILVDTLGNRNGAVKSNAH